MSLDDDMRERHGRVLAELAETGMVMVRRLSDAMLRTDDVQTQAEIGLAYHRVSRAVRQTMALEFRLAQAAQREARTPQAPPPPKPASAAPAEPAPARPASERVGWSEHERDDSDEALDALDALLEADELDVEAVHEAIESSMARIRQDLTADPRLAGVLEAAGAPPAAPTPTPRTRRSELMGAATVFARPDLAASKPANAKTYLWRSSG